MSQSSPAVIRAAVLSLVVATLLGSSLQPCQAGGAPKVYTNAVGNLAQATNDINAFSCP